jgi:hypothetical protein
MNSSGPPPPPPPARRGGIGRLALVAALGAAAVLGYQALATGGGHGTSRAGQAATGTTALAGAVSPDRGATGAAFGGATGAIPAGGAGATGATGAGATGATGAGATGPTGGPANTTVHRPVTGPRLVVVVDQPAGPFAQQNRLIMQGAIVGLAQLDAAGGIAHHAVRLVTEKLDGLSPAAVQQRLKVAGPGAVLMLPCDSNWQSRLATGAAPYKTLMLAPCDADAALGRAIATYWPVGMAGNDEAAGLAGFMQRIGYQSTFVVDTPGLAYAASMTRYFRAAVQARKLRVTGSATVSLSLGPAEIARVAAGIKAAKVRSTSVFSALPAPYINRLAAGLLHDGVHQILLGTSAMDTPLTLAKGSAALENATFPSYGFLDQDPAAAAFAAAYRTRFGLPVGSFPGLGFETIRLLAAAVARAGSTSPAAISLALSAGLQLPGAALADRAYAAGGDHNPTSTVSVEKISAGSFLPLLTSAPTNVPAA